MIVPLPRPEDAAPPWTTVDWRPFVADTLVDGRRLRYLDYGTGPTLVLLHGMASSWQWWLENIPELARHHRVIAVDLPGCGDSEPLPSPAEMATHAHAVLDLLTGLDIKSAVVVGHSMGGLVAIAMATTAPHRVRSLVLVDAGGVPMSERRLAATLVVLRICAAVMRRGFVRRLLAEKAWVRRYALRGAFRDPDVLYQELAERIMPAFAGPGFVGSVPAAGRAVRATQPESIGCPVLLVWGEHDGVAPLYCAQDMHARLPNSELVVIAGVGHTPMVESPAEFNRAVINFTRAFK
ncbi:hypothetical protein AU184_25930 [Mycolicibacterium novocastrense]|uniref:alpha/beta fold hydrolase n=1 Tax=Mycolicibacterium novocastrense TaxID=59813 RepID=UPI0007460965|nr:alpha/beta hydrolase [Mycolicibacterium novocastrense]KUH70847.1 hypothetical protein AU072_18365 [Mycolicibacterium novocastrense]KUH71188.1 hypothetical protein AU183_20290 [Mycolicibacterium novocastrense]KUH73295.1 hypothetical protein AU184_25930 [Mycolicibacterium novocastrense]